MNDTRDRIEERVRQTVFGVLDELNEQLPARQRLPKADTTVLAGEQTGLDSLGLVNLMALLEQRIESEFQIPINLMDEELVDEASTHLADVRSSDAVPRVCTGRARRWVTRVPS